MAPVIERLLDGFRVSEGPHWDDKNQCLYFVDLSASDTVHRYVPATKKHTKAKVGNHIASFIIPVKNEKDQFVIALDRTIVLINWDGESDEVIILKKLYEVDDGKNTILNDGKCDKNGRIWSGTLSRNIKDPNDIYNKKGTFYSFQNNIAKPHKTEISLSNGIAFDYELGKMYYVDSFRKSIYQFDFDVETGTISNEIQICKAEDYGLKKEIYDGITLDSNGNLWVAIFGGSSVYKINPRAPEKVLEILKFPAIQITSVAFGGPNLDELYVTSANITDFQDFEGGSSPGSLFRVTGLNAKGLPADEFVL